MASTPIRRGRMHPDSQHHDVSRDPILDGRDSLRLVKLRLALTLIAVAVLPIAAVSPLVRAVAEEARVTHHERLADQAATAVARAASRARRRAHGGRATCSTTTRSSRRPRATRAPRTARRRASASSSSWRCPTRPSSPPPCSGVTARSPGSAGRRISEASRRQAGRRPDLVAGRRPRPAAHRRDERGRGEAGTDDRHRRLDLGAARRGDTEHRDARPRPAHERRQRHPPCGDLGQLRPERPAGRDARPGDDGGPRLGRPRGRRPARHRWLADRRLGADPARRAACSGPRRARGDAPAPGRLHDLDGTPDPAAGAAAGGIAVSPPRAVRERPRGRAARQPDRARQPPGVPGGRRPDGRGRPPVRDGLLAGAHRHRRVQAHQRHPRPRGRRPAPGRGRQPHQRDHPPHRRGVPGGRRRVRAPPAAHRCRAARSCLPGGSSPAASRTGCTASTAPRSRSPPA